MTTEPENKKHNMSNLSIANRDEIEMNGIIYYIPDNLIIHDHLPIEHYNLYKFILSRLISIGESSPPKSYSHGKNYIQNMTITANKLFSYLLGGKIDIITLSKTEQQIIDTIPQSIIPKINPNIIEQRE
jgi:hypothetical protein